MFHVKRTPSSFRLHYTPVKILSIPKTNKQDKRYRIWTLFENDGWTNLPAYPSVRYRTTISRN